MKFVLALVLSLDLLTAAHAFGGNAAPPPRCVITRSHGQIFGDEVYQCQEYETVQPGVGIGWVKSSDLECYPNNNMLSNERLCSQGMRELRDTSL
jgi:hypothetical protein